MNDGGTNTRLAIVLAGLVLVVAALGFLMFNDDRAGHWPDRPADRLGTLP
ncbi:MAG: hypothetical protein ABSA49_15145 [Rhizomicrobium sp.]